MAQTQGLDDFLSGRRIYGDDFDAERWRPGIATRRTATRRSPSPRKPAQLRVPRNELAPWFPALKGERFEHALGFGSGFGYELMPIIERIGRVSLVDSAAVYQQSELPVASVRTFKADQSGVLPFGEREFDLSPASACCTTFPTCRSCCRNWPA